MAWPFWGQAGRHLGRAPLSCKKQRSAILVLGQSFMIGAITRADHFPTNIYQTTLEDPAPLNAALMRSIAAARGQDPAGIERSNFAEIGGWHSGTNLHLDPEYMRLAQIIRAFGAEIAKDQGYAARLRLDISAMWAITNAPGASNQAHIHSGALWSGVYYIQAEDRAGDIEFTDPRTANLMRQPIFDAQPDHAKGLVRYAPTPGRMLVFPSWLYHAVRPNLSGSERVIISFNLGVS